MLISVSKLSSAISYFDKTWLLSEIQVKCASLQKLHRMQRLSSLHHVRVLTRIESVCVCVCGLAPGWCQPDWHHDDWSVILCVCVCLSVAVTVTSAGFVLSAVTAVTVMSVSAAPHQVDRELFIITLCFSHL